MLEALEQMLVPKSFLLDTFFSKQEQSLTKYVDIDIVKGNRKLAPFVRPIDQGKVVERLGYTTKSFEVPYIKVKMKSNAQEHLQRAAGQTIYVGSSPAKRAAEQHGKDLAYLQDLVARREEEMASQALQTGKVVVVGDSINAEIDFGSSVVPQNASTMWEQNNSDPIKDLRTWVRTLSQRSGIMPDICVMGFDAITEFLDDAKVQKLIDLRRVDIGQINPSLLPSGASFVGTLRVPGLTLDLYGYDESYTDSAGDTQYFVHPKKIIIGSTKARTARHYASIQDIKFGGLVPVRWFPKSWEEEDPSIQWLLLQSAALPCLHQPDAFICGTVVTI